MPKKPIINLKAHKTIFIVIFWLVLLAISLFFSSPEGVRMILSVAGWISLSYVGVSKVGEIVTAAKAPAGEFGFDYVPFFAEKYWWVVVYWCLISVAIMILDGRSTVGYPYEDAVFFAGFLSVGYAGLNKGVQVAASLGKEPAAPF
jgi:hypothetical protein